MQLQNSTFCIQLFSIFFNQDYIIVDFRMFTKKKEEYVIIYVDNKYDILRANINIHFHILH